MLSVTINKTHLDQKRGLGQYSDKDDCPLARALKEQHPALPLLHVTGLGSIFIANPDKSSKQKEIHCAHIRQFDADSGEQWDMGVCRDMFEGKIDSVTLTYDINY